MSSFWRDSFHASARAHRELAKHAAIALERAGLGIAIEPAAAKAAELDEMQRIVIDLDTNDAVSFDDDPEAIPEAPSGDDDEYGRPWDVFYGALLSCRVPFT